MSDYNDFLLPEPCLRMDTHFGDEYESVELGDGTGYVKAAPTLARLGALHVELDELRDENAKLREERDTYRDLVGLMDHPDLNVQLQAENAKLRELVQNLRRVLPADVVGVVIGANTDHPSYYKFDKAFRELGVEVDG